jgi:hypothetical protein
LIFKIIRSSENVSHSIICESDPYPIQGRSEGYRLGEIPFSEVSIDEKLLNDWGLFLHSVNKIDWSK